MAYELVAWDQEKGVYEGEHDVKRVLASVTIEDVLWAMYTVNVELTDENLEAVIGELNAKLFAEFEYDLEAFVDKAINGERESEER